MQNYQKETTGERRRADTRGAQAYAAAQAPERCHAHGRMPQPVKPSRYRD
jgi:hypothetical protein